MQMCMAQAKTMLSSLEECHLLVRRGDKLIERLDGLLGVIE
jgi:hypothetical protein